MAKTVGSPVIRCFLGNQADRGTHGGIETHIKNAVEVCKAVRADAVAAGVKIAFENHAGDMQAWELAGLVEAAGPDYVGVNIDPGNATWTLEDPVASLETLAPYVACTSIRDSAVWETETGVVVEWVAMGDGNVDFTRWADLFAEKVQGRAGVPRDLRRAAPSVQLPVRSGILQAVAEDAGPGSGALPGDRQARQAARGAAGAAAGRRAGRRRCGAAEGHLRAERRLLPQRARLRDPGVAVTGWRVDRPRPRRTARSSSPGKALTFLRALKRNNDGEWFRAHRADYVTHIQEPLHRLLETLNDDLHDVAPELACTARESTFRMYRDTRFSEDKTPLKTHVAWSLRPRGFPKGYAAGLYAQFDPSETWIGGGLYHPEPAVRTAEREHIAAAPSAPHARSCRHRPSGSTSARSKATR